MITGAARAACCASSKPVAMASVPTHGLDTPTTSGSGSPLSASARSSRSQRLALVAAEHRARARARARRGGRTARRAAPGRRRSRSGPWPWAASASLRGSPRHGTATSASFGWSRSQPRRRARPPRPSRRRPAMRSAKKSLIRLRSSSPSISRIFLMPTAVWAAIDVARSRSSSSNVRPPAARATRKPISSPSADSGTVSVAGVRRAARQRRRERARAVAVEAAAAAQLVRQLGEAERRRRVGGASARRRGAAAGRSAPRGTRARRRRAAAASDCVATSGSSSSSELGRARSTPTACREPLQLAHPAPGRGVQARVLDRAGHERRGVDDEGRVLLAEHARRLRVQGDHADHLVVLADQRHGDDRLVLLLVELREVLDARVGEGVVRDERRPAVLGDPAREPLAAAHRAPSRRPGRTAPRRPAARAALPPPSAMKT